MIFPIPKKATYSDGRYAVSSALATIAPPMQIASKSTTIAVMQIILVLFITSSP